MAIIHEPMADGRTKVVIDFRDQDFNRVREVAAYYKTARQRVAAQDAAVALLEQRKREVRAKTYANPRSTRGRNPLFSDFAQTFLADYASTKRSNFYEQYAALLVAEFGKFRLSEFDRKTLDAFLACAATPRCCGRCSASPRSGGT